MDGPTGDCSEFTSPGPTITYLPSNISNPVRERSHETRTIIYRSSLSNRGKREPNPRRRRKGSRAESFAAAILALLFASRKHGSACTSECPCFLVLEGEREEERGPERESAKRVEAFVTLRFAFKKIGREFDVSSETERNDGAVVEVDGSSLKVSSSRGRGWREMGMEELEFKEKRDSVVGADFQVEFPFLEAKGSGDAGWGSGAKLQGRGSWLPRWPHVGTRSERGQATGRSSRFSIFHYSREARSKIRGEAAAEGSRRFNDRLDGALMS